MVQHIFNTQYRVTNYVKLRLQKVPHVLSLMKVYRQRAVYANGKIEGYNALVGSRVFKQICQHITHKGYFFKWLKR